MQHYEKPAQPPMVTAVYARVSSEEQAREGYSLESQERAARLYCELHGLTNITVYIEPGLSGREVEHRLVFQQLMADVTAGQVGHIVVWRLSRLHRNLADFLRTLTLLEAQDVSLHSITEHVDTHSATGRLLVSILMAFHEFESEKLSEDVTAGMLQKVRSGGWANQAPMGYAMERGELTVDEAKAGTVREVFRRAEEGESLRSLADLGIGIPTLSYILSNPVYAGFTFEHRDRLPDHPRLITHLAQAQGVYPGRHTPLVEPALWDRVQLVRHRVSHRTDDKSRHIFSGILRCLNCGGPVQTHYAARRMYRCSTRPPCYSVSAERLELTLLTYLRDLQEDHSLGQDMEAQLTRDLADAEAQVAKPLREAEKELAVRRRQEERWRKLYVEAKIGEQQYLLEAPRLEEERRYWEMRVEVLKSRPIQADQELVAFREQWERVGSIVTLLLDVWDDSTDTEKALAVRELIEFMQMGKSSLTVKGWALPAVSLPYAELRGRGPKSPASGKTSLDKVSILKSRRAVLYRILT